MTPSHPYRGGDVLSILCHPCVRALRGVHRLLCVHPHARVFRCVRSLLSTGPIQPVIKSQGVHEWFADCIIKDKIKIQSTGKRCCSRHFSESVTFWLASGAGSIHGYKEGNIPKVGGLKLEYLRRI